MIQVGQDALGGWAWMLFARGKKSIDSGDNYRTVDAAMAAAADAWAEAKIRGQPGIGDCPRFTFPDGAPKAI